MLLSFILQNIWGNVTELQIT